MPDTKPFAEKAARFSLCSPFIAFGLAMLSSMGQAGPRPPKVAAVQGAISLTLVLAGLIMGFVALAGIRRHGSRGILGRAVVGLTLNGMIVAAMVVAIPLYRTAAAAVIPSQGSVTGRWQRPMQLPDGRNVTADLCLNGDGTFQMDLTGDADARMSGSWLLEDGIISIHPMEASTRQVQQPMRMKLGMVKKVNSTEMVLTTRNGDEVYRRRP